MSVTVHHGDNRDILRGLPDNSIDSIVTDPPYALVSIQKRFGKPGSAPAKGDIYARASAGFMGKQWDTGEVAFAVEFWAEILRVLKPGGHVVAFSGTRTYHRLACAVEDAGFEIRDMLQWLYGSGFPKSHDVSKGIDKAAGVEREVIGRKADPRYNSPATATSGAPMGNINPRPNSVENYAKAALITGAATPESAQWTGWGTALKPACEPIVLARKPLDGTVVANVLAHGTGALNIDGCRVEAGDRYAENAVTQGVSTARTSYDFRQQAGIFKPSQLGRWPANIVHDGSEEVVGAFPASKDGVAGSRTGTSKIAAAGLGAYEHEWGGYGGEGSAARFFYTAKADATDRLGSKHPTVKPTDLMRWLVRLVTPPGGTVLDPFAGSGSTGVACIAEGFDAILIEREAEYVADIRRRIAWAQGDGRLTAQELGKKQEGVEALPLFGGAA